MRIRNFLFGSFVFISGFSARADVDLVSAVKAETGKCSSIDYRSLHARTCADVEQLLNDLIDSNNIEEIHNIYLKKNVQMEMQYGLPTKNVGQ